MSVSPLDKPFRTRIRRDLDETTNRGIRARILTDCLIERLIAIQLGDRTDYLDAVEREVQSAIAAPEASSLGTLFSPGVVRTLAAKKRSLLRLAICDEFMETGLDEGLWHSTMARLTGERAPALDDTAFDRFVAICRFHGWAPPADMAAAI